MNKVVLMGRLVRDPELRTTGTGKSVCSFNVAVDRRFKQEGQPTADFIPVVAWGRQAEIISQYLSKGCQIALSGRIQTRSYDAQDGSKRYVTEIVLEEFDFVSDRSGQSSYGNNSYGQGYGEPVQQASGNAMPLNLADDDFHLLAEDDDVPF